MRRPRLLIASDGTEAARCAVRIAGQIAVAFQARTYVVHVESFVSNVKAGPTPEELAKDELAQFGLKPTILRRAGEPADEILAAARGLGCDLLVMGSRGRSNVAGRLLGSVSQEIVSQAEFPVLLVREGSDVWRALRRIVLAIEGTEGVEPLADITGRLARALDADVSVVHVSYPGGEKLERSLYHARQTHGEEACAAAVARLSQQGIRAETVQIRTHIGIPRAIAKFADGIGAGLIVIGAHREADQRARVGESISVAHLTTRPVLVTREP